MEKIIVHDREPPKSPSRHMSKMVHFKRKDTPEKYKIQNTKRKPHQKNK